jgi:hypothetical protein
MSSSPKQVTIPTAQWVCIISVLDVANLQTSLTVAGETLAVKLKRAPAVNRVQFRFTVDPGTPALTFWMDDIRVAPRPITCAD